MAEAITSFTGKHRFLSNFYPAAVTYAGVIFPTVEHAYQASKSAKPADHLRIAALPSAGQAKRAGRKLDIRHDFERDKLLSMFYLLLLKFKDNDLRALLLATGDAELVEGNTWGDIYWGICDGVGENQLGKALMSVRRHYRG